MVFKYCFVKLSDQTMYFSWPPNNYHYYMSYHITRRIATITKFNWPLREPTSQGPPWVLDPSLKFHFSSFTFSGAPYQIFLLFLPWLPCHFYLVITTATSKSSIYKHLVLGNFRHNPLQKRRCIFSQKRQCIFPALSARKGELLSKTPSICTGRFSRKNVSGTEEGSQRQISLSLILPK